MPFQRRHSGGFRGIPRQWRRKEHLDSLPGSTGEIYWSHDLFRRLTYGLECAPALSNLVPSQRAHKEMGDTPLDMGKWKGEAMGSPGRALTLHAERLPPMSVCAHSGALRPPVLPARGEAPPLAVGEARAKPANHTHCRLQQPANAAPPRSRV